MSQDTPLVPRPPLGSRDSDARGADGDRWRWAFETHMDPFAFFALVRDDAGEPYDLRYTDLNPAACAYHGLPAEQVLGRTLRDFYPGLEESGYLGRYLATATIGTPVVIDDTPYVNEVYGEERWYDLRAVKAAAGIALTWRDVTERHRLDQRLAEESHRFQLMLTSLYDVVVYSVDGIVEWISPAVESLLGYSAAELVGRSTECLWHPDDLPREAVLRDTATGGSEGVAELRIRHRNGRNLWVEVAVSPHVDPRGQVGTVASMRDITDRVHAEEALVQREQEYRLLAENAGDIVFRGNPEGIVQWVSPSVMKVLGWAPGEVVGRYVPDLLTPEDRPIVLNAMRALERGETAYYEARFRTAAGGTRWLAVRGQPVFDEAGAFVGRVATARDLEPEVAARRDRDAFHERFRTAFESAAIGMAMVAESGEFIAVNTAMAQMVGREVDWFPGRLVRDCVHPADRSLSGLDREALWQGRKSVASREVRLVSSDGETVWVRRTGAVVRDAAGNPEFVLLQIQDLTRERTALDRLDLLQFHDELTGLRNRAWLVDHLDEALRDAVRTDTPLALLLADLDQFKLVNDSLGHEVGDDLVIVAGRRIGAAAGAGSAVSRFGGDEFVVVLPDGGDPIEVEHRTAHILAAIAEPVSLAGHDLSPTACVGIAVSDPQSTVSSLLRDADAALYRAKSRGRGHWQFADPGLHDDAVLRLMTEEELRTALEADEIRVHYQPIVRLSDCALVSHEALVRWQHPVRGLLGPGDFLEVAEDSGLMRPLHQRILELVANDLAKDGLLGRVSINLSGTILAEATWADDLITAMTRRGVEPSRLAVEVTETAILPSLDSVGAGFTRLRDLSVGIHLDDFGTGYSSIALLRDLPVTAIKLDASFVRDITAGSSHARSLAAGLGGLVDRLGLVGIAEGIEEERVVAELIDLGWSQGQGYLFGRPAPLVG